MKADHLEFLIGENLNLKMGEDVAKKFGWNQA
jgi:hypothetical protein